MAYRFIFTAWFDRNLKSLRKHNPNLRTDFESFLNMFDAEAHPVVPGTGGARKARISAKGKGKRGGYRLVYYLFKGDKVWLITIYDKVQKENLSPAEERVVSRLIEQIRESSS